MAKPTPIIAMSAPVSITAGKADAEGAQKPAEFDVTFYTGGALNIAGYDLPVVVDLAGLTRGNVLVANLDHEPTKRVGNFDVANDGKTLTAHGAATAVTTAADEVVKSAANGYQWQASLEVSPQQIEQVKAGKSVVVNGQTLSGPLYVTRKGTLKGFAFVSHGADDNTTVSIAASAADSKENNMRAEVKEWIKARFPSVDIEAMTSEEVQNWEDDYDGKHEKRQTAKPTQKAGDSVAREMQEVKRRDQFESLTANFLSSINADCKTVEFLQGVSDIKARAIDENWTPEKYDGELLRATIPLARTVSTPRRDSERLNDEILKAAICQAGGLNNIEKHFDDRTLQTAKERFKEGIGLNQLLKIAAEAHGYRSESYRANLEMQRAAFGMLGSPMMHGSGFSTISLPGILSDSAYKFLLEGWGGGEMTWESVTDVATVRDFKTITQYKLSGTLKYEKVGPTGEIKHGQVSEGSYSVKADTYGKMLAITREHIINDDLNALAQAPRELGYGANEAFNEVFWTEWLGGDGSFFAYTSSGTITASTVLASLEAAEKKFYEMTKPNGQPLGVNPTLILAPNGSHRIFLNAMASTQVAGGSTTVPAANTYANEYRVVRSAYLSNTSYSGYSPVKWYLMAVRPGFAPIQTAFLNGQRSPMIETASADFNQLGIQMRGVHDFGVNLFEARSAVQGSGA